MLTDLAPPPSGTFPTYDDLLSQLQDYARAHGYAVAVDKSKHEWGGLIRT